MATAIPIRINTIDAATTNPVTKRNNQIKIKF